MTRKNLKQANDGAYKDDSSHHQLLNFHFSRAPPTAQQHQTRRPRSGSGSGSRPNRQPHQRNNTKNQQQDRRTAEDRASARRKAAANMFPLHSSCDHAFVISRRRTTTTTNGPQQYAFQGPDEAVSWESVKIVKHLISVEQSSQSCPICLDDMQCARVTKCGHCFCLPCLIHHVQSINSQQQAKCPCCAIPLHLEDVRPVQFVTVMMPSAGCNMKFVKLHRVRDCPAPYLPVPTQPRRSATLYAAPCQTDADAPYSRFVYVNPESYRALLEYNHNELLALQQRQQSMLDGLCIDMALQMVRNDQTLAANCANEEMEALEQFHSPTAGIYQPQPCHLMAAAAAAASHTTVNDMTLFTASAVDGPSSWDDNNDHLHDEHSFAASSAVPLRRDRVDSMASCGATSACSYNSNTTTASDSVRRTAGGSMYINEEEYAFYQAEDGSLCFLSGFNMKCLQTEFAATLPTPSNSSEANVSEEIQDLSLSRTTTTPSPQRQRQQHEQDLIKPPLPDTVEGKVLEVERVHLTYDIRQRRRFLSHLPLYTDICFVEISLGHLLSNRTKKIFKKEFQKRNQARMNKSIAEKRADERVRRKEEARINELKSRIQRIDPMDEFFQPAAQPPEPVLTGDDFGPSISGLSSGIIPTTTTAAILPGNEGRGIMSFSQICRAGEDFPSLSSAPTETNFPALGSSPLSSRKTSTLQAATWGRSIPLKSAPAGASLVSPPSSPSKGGKKGKGKKIVLFSTGAQRGVQY